MPNLTEHQIQHIIELLQAGEDLPLDYKHLLFPPERQEYELVYAGKEREEDILAETAAQCRRILSYDLDEATRKRLKDKLAKVKKLLKRAERRLNREEIAYEREN